MTRREKAGDKIGGTHHTPILLALTISVFAAYCFLLGYSGLQIAEDADLSLMGSIAFWTSIVGIASPIILAAYGLASFHVLTWRSKTNSLDNGNTV